MNSTGYQFGGYTLDLARASLRRDGEETVLRRKSFDVLRYFVENAGRVITKDEIFAAIWPDVTVTDDSLVQCVRDIRQAFGDDAAQLIKTIPRRGYLFDAAVLTSDAYAAAQQAESAAHAKWWHYSGRRPAAIALLVLLSVGLAAAWFLTARDRVAEPAGPPSIAVLFSASGTGNGVERTYDYFSDGLSDDVIGALGRFSGLRVLARSSLDRYKNGWDPAQLRRGLGVRYILDGVVRRSGERIRVTARLTDAAQNVLLWSDTYDEDLNEVFAVQDRLTRSIVGRLAVRLTRIEQERAVATPTLSVQAYDHVLRGREKLARITRVDNLEARRLFNAALELDPRYAAALIGLGHTYHNDVLFGWSARPDEAWRRAYEFAHRAVTFDDKDAAGFQLLANIYVISREYGLALAEADRAIALNQNDADGHAVRGAVLVWMGRVEEAIAAFEAAAQFDPNQTRPRSLAHLGIAYFLNARYDDAVRAFEASIGRNPEFVLAYVGLAATYGELGKRGDAERTAEMVRRLDPFFTSTAFGTQLAQDAHRLRMVESLRRIGL